jgi:sulfonate transport system ATP-binding protein
MAEPMALADAGREIAVSVTDLSRGFGTNSVLRHLDMQIHQGEFIALLGRSGSGKTTLLRTLAGLDPAPIEHVVTPPRRAVVFQEPRLLPWRKVWRNVALGLRVPDARERALAALAEVGLAERADAWPLTLSGGEAQRAALARALVREPQLLLLDEPFASLDALTRIRMHRLVAALFHAHRPAVMLVTHDVDEAVLLADRVLVLADGHTAAEHILDMPRVRRHEHPEFGAYRNLLLRELGVGDDEATPRAVQPRKPAPVAQRIPQMSSVTS